MVKKTTIKINKDTREILREISADDESVDMVIRRIFDDVNMDLQDAVWLTGKTNVDVSVDTANMIKGYKISEFESYDSILRRVISLYLDKIR